MNTVVSIVTGATSILVAVVTATLAILQRVKAFKWQQQSHTLEAEIEELKSKSASAAGIFELYQKDLLEIMSSAETMGMIGSAKKAYVKAQIVLLCNENGITYNDSDVEALIESLINFSKAVNCITTNPASNTCKINEIKEIIKPVVEAVNSINNNYTDNSGIGQ